MFPPWPGLCHAAVIAAWGRRAIWRAQTSGCGGRQNLFASLEERTLQPVRQMARQCSGTGGPLTARIGIQGRVIAGPAGAPTSIQVPIRVAVVQGGVSEKTIATKAYQTTVNMSETGSEPFTLVAEDLVYPVPPGALGDSYIFYIGFDPQALKPERAAPAKKKKQP